MSVHSVQNNQQVAQAEAVSNAQSAKKQAAQVSALPQVNALPQDKVTISEAAQGKQTAAAIGADVDHGGK